MSDLSLASQDPKRVMHSIIQRIATGPELSKNISREEAYLGMKAILDGQIDPIQIGIFFIALRMKRETADENLGVLDAILEATQRVTAAVDDVLDIADPYDGYSRCLPAAPFLAPLMAELGVPTVSHALEAVGPKYGVTARHVLRAAGVNVDLSPAAAAARLSEPGLGWTYIDQAQFCPKLHDLVGVRARMVKRQVITTVEVLAQPIVGRQRTHFVTGYVHKPYPPVYAMLARAAGFDSALIIRGVEGGVIPSLRQPGKVFAYHDQGEEIGRDINPQDLGIAQELRAVALPGMPPGKDTVDEIATALDIPATAQVAADAGMAALSGSRGATYDSLVLSASLMLHHLGRAKSLAEAAEQTRAALDTGRAAARVK